MKLGEKILKLRKEHGLSQEELGEKINVTRQTISNWELGETTPNVEQLKLLSKELNVSIDELLDNNIQNVIVEKVSNTEKLAGLILRILKIFLIGIPIIILLNIILAFVYRFVVNNKYTGREIEENIYCELYGEKHSYSITYQELTNIPIAQGGDGYFDNILDLGKYNYAYQIFDIINDYVKKNGGTCRRMEGRDLSDVIDVTVKENTLTKTSATIIIKTDYDYNISFGESFWLEKYNYKNNYYEKLTTKENNCTVNMIGYDVTPNKPLELNQDWSCMYGELNNGLYRIVKNVYLDLDEYYIWTEFEIK